MKILAIETTDQTGSVALFDGRRIVAEVRLPSHQRSAQSLAPAIATQLAAAAWRPKDIELVAVAVGPGSFNGLRVGVTTAKTFAYAVECSLVGVPTLEAIAAQATESGNADDRTVQIFAVLDAGRQRVFAARFRSAGEKLECIEPTALVDDEVWLAGLLDQSRRGEVLSGPGLKKFTNRLPHGVRIAAEEIWGPRAATIGQLALQRYELGQRDDPWQLAPLYHRLSAAEEKLALANQKRER